MAVRTSSADKAAAARAEAARKAAEARAEAARKAAEAKAEQARQKAEAQAAKAQQPRQTASADVQRGSRARASAGDQAARARLNFAGTPDSIDRNSAANTRRNADTQTNEAREAARVADRDNATADTAFGAHEQAQRALNEARESNAPASEVRPLEERASEAQTNFEQAERTAQASTDTSVREAEEALTAQRSANGAARNAGGTEPFPAANEVENVRDLAKATPEQQRAILGGEAAFTEHDVTRVENRARAQEATDAVAPLQENAREAHEAVSGADARVNDAQQRLSDAESARDGVANAPPQVRRELDEAVSSARNDLARAESEAFDARKTAHESTQELLGAQHTANEAARDAGDPPPFGAAAKARTAEDVASLSRAEQREILGTESAISASEAGAVASSVRTDQVNEAAGRINGETDPQRAAELLTEELGATNDPQFRAELLENTGDAQRAIGARLTSDDLSENDAQALTDQLAQAGELAGQDHARTLTDGVAAGMDGDGLRGEVKDALENTVREGNGALFGVELGQSLQAQGKGDAAKDALEKTKHGIEAVQEEYASASEDALAREGDLARVREQWSASGAFNQAELDAGEQAFRAEHSETFDRFGDASANLASTLNGADAALRAYDDPNSNIRSIDNDEGRKTAEAAREVMNGAPDLVHTEAGQQALGEAAIRQGEGERTWLQGANEYGRTLEGQEGEAFQDRMASATMQAAVSGMDQLADGGRAGERSLAVQGAADALGDVAPGSVAAEMKGALSDISDEVARVEANSGDLTPIEASEQLADSVSDVVNTRFDNLAAANGGELSDTQRAARDRLSLVGTAAGVAGLGQATYNLITDPSVQTAAQVASEGISLAGEAGQARVLQVGRELGFKDSELTRATRPLRALAVGGAAIGIFTGETTLQRVQAGTETAIGAAGLIGELSAFGAASSGTRAAVGVGLRAVGKASLVVGLGFSAIDTYQAFQRGDVAGAAIAGAPLAGAAIGAGIGVWAGGVGAVPGAAIGFAVGGVISIGGSIARNIFGESDEEKFEKRTDSFLEGALSEAGLPESAAERLRDVDGDFEGMARSLPALADAAGTTPREVLRTVANLPDDQLEDFVKSALDIPHNAEDIQEARGKLVEGENVDVPDFRLETGSDQFRDALALLQGHLG